MSNSYSFSYETKEGGDDMKKFLLAGFVAFAISFFIATSVNAQTATPSPTRVPTQTPSGAPNTGFGFN